VPDELKTAELCHEAVKQNWAAAGFVPKEHLTVELCLEAVKQNTSLLRFVPRKLRDEVSRRLNEEK